MCPTTELTSTQLLALKASNGCACTAGASDNLPTVLRRRPPERPVVAQEIRGGRYPYLYGGRPEGCTKCQSEEHVAKFCQFGLDGYGQCWGGRREQLVQYYLQRGFTDILTFTPCDLWPLLKGRTLFFSGDSQTQVLTPNLFLS